MVHPNMTLLLWSRSCTSFFRCKSHIVKQLCSLSHSHLPLAAGPTSTSSHGHINTKTSNTLRTVGWENSYNGTFEGRTYSSRPPNISVDDPSSIARDIFEATLRIDVMAATIPIKDIEQLAKIALSHDFTTDQIHSLLTGRVWLLRQNNDLLTLLDFLKSHGFSPRVALGLVEWVPAERQERPLSEITNTVEYSMPKLGRMGISHEDVLMLVDDTPVLLVADLSVCEENWQLLKDTFTNDDARTVLLNCPKVLTDPWTVTEAKLNYAHLTMGCYQGNIVKSSLFRYTLEHIQDRHLFLARAGLYVYVKLNDDPRLNPNPALQHVLDVRSRHLTSKLDCPDHSQYHTFIAMREVERRMEEVENEEEGESEEDDNNTVIDYSVKRGQRNVHNELKQKNRKIKKLR